MTGPRNGALNGYGTRKMDIYGNYIFFSLSEYLTWLFKKYERNYSCNFTNFRVAFPSGFSVIAPFKYGCKF